MSEEVEKRIQTVRNISKECIQEEELNNLLASKPTPICYDGIEPSGRMTIAEGLFKVINVNKMISAGCRVKIVIANLFAQLNNKMDCDMKKIRVVGEYYIETWKSLGMIDDDDRVEFLWSSDEIYAKPEKYLPVMMDIAIKSTLGKIKGCVEIMGHSVADQAAHILYICMQCADVIFLEADICQLGMDQRQVNLLAREYCDIIGRENKPIILSHDMLHGLQGQEKMSKSDPLSCLFMDENEGEINLKIKKAFCPPNIVKGNPCLEYIKRIILPWFNEFSVERNEEYGGNKTFTRFEDVVADYKSGKLHPGDLKNGLMKALNKILQPVRDHYKTDNRFNNLLKQMKASKVHTKGHQKVSDEASSGTSSSTGLQLSEEDEERYQILRSIGEQCIEEGELKNLLANKHNPICYDGFEPSGRMHIAQGVIKVINVRKMTSAGCKVKIWIADWFAQLNNKMGGDLKKIRLHGEYFIEIWKAYGLDVEFLWSSDEINSRADKYLPIVIDIALRTTLNRIIRCDTIMGRKLPDEQKTAAMILYPLMQCADIFFLEADICQLGMDQTKVNMLARDYCDAIKRKYRPVILSHYMLPGLVEGQEKMSKSNPLSAIFMDDEEGQINLKINNAFCPPKIVEGNPCLEYIEYIVLPWFKEFTVERNEEHGGDKTFTSFEDICAEYESGELCPGDVKSALAKAINMILQPVRDHLERDPWARSLHEQVQGLRVTK